MSSAGGEKFCVYVAYSDNCWRQVLSCGGHDSEKDAAAAAVAFASYYVNFWARDGVPPLVVSTSEDGPEYWRMEFFAIPAATKEELDAMESFCDTEPACDVHMLVPAAKTRAEIVRGFIERYRT